MLAFEEQTPVKKRRTKKIPSQAKEDGNDHHDNSDGMDYTHTNNSFVLANGDENALMTQDDDDEDNDDHEDINDEDYSDSSNEEEEDEIYKEIHHMLEEEELVLKKSQEQDVLNNSQIDDTSKLRLSLTQENFEISLLFDDSKPTLLPYIHENYNSFFKLWKHGFVHIDLNSTIVDYHVQHLIHYTSRNNSEIFSDKTLKIILIDINDYPTITKLLYSILMKMETFEKVKKAPSKSYFLNMLSDDDCVFYDYRFCLIVRGVNEEVLPVLNDIFNASNQNMCVFNVDNKPISFNNVTFKSNGFNCILPNILYRTINTTNVDHDIAIITNFLMKNISLEGKHRHEYEDFIELVLRTHIHMEKNVLVYVKLIPSLFNYCHNEWSKEGSGTTAERNALNLFKKISNFSFHQLVIMFDIYNVKALDMNHTLTATTTHRSTVMDGNLSTTKSTGTAMNISQLVSELDLANNTEIVDCEILEKFIIVASYIASRNAKQWDALLDNKSKPKQQRKKRKKESESSTSTTKIDSKKVNKNQLFDIPRLLFILRNLISNSPYAERFSGGPDFIPHISNLISKSILEWKKEVESNMDHSLQQLTLSSKYNYSVVRDCAAEINIATLFERYVNE
ncbi:hypothetical protein C9374_000978 [Naegleria lovaniensis]|uniref:Origin recognition complex subunit 5 C-terminal domain-containing protein n=1 Tax=Naegleria lovaniensis TaxID=51637 RepID=A0AA88GXD9_NAELO|nr:uncharacterized protein C9374_000978 [Naegleria lovaniensis]KAG2388128.1 hypothetical protein C9374_000978 [Naegleria lovaniensis]